MAVSPPNQQRCPRCQSPVTPGARFCPNCGQDFASTHYGSSSPGESSAAPQNQAPVHASINQPAAYQNSQAQGNSSDDPLPLDAPAGIAGRLPISAPAPVRQKSNHRSTFLSIIIIILLLLLGGAGALIYLLSRPQAAAPAPLPTIFVTSGYHVGATPAGATGTVLHVKGQQFTANSAITFLLDNSPAPDIQTAQSDKSGTVQADLMVSSAWSFGTHTLSARDANGRAPANGATITIVAQGEAMTPGPDGAPYDSQTFNLAVTVSPADAVTGAALPGFTDALAVTGKPDPAGGAVCDPKNDTGQPVTETGTSGGINYTLTFVATCSGSYKGGMLTYTETASSYQIAFVNGVTCRANVPFVNQSLTGSFTSATTINGTYTADALIFNCSNGQSIQNNPQKGTWVGTVNG